jgi:hypothetical protein
LVRARLCKLQITKYTRLAVASDKVYQLLAHGRWFSPGTPASSNTKTGRHNIAEIMLKVALKQQKSINQPIIGSPTVTLIYTINKQSQIRYHSKRPHTMTKKNNINMDNALARSMKVRLAKQIESVAFKIIII